MQSDAADAAHATQIELSINSESQPFQPDNDNWAYGSNISGTNGWGRIEIYRQHDQYCLRCCGVAEFYIRPPSNRVICFACRGVSGGLVDALSVGPVRALFCELRGLLCLHASAVVMHGRAVGFAGASGSGKSTLALSLVRSGHALLTDDVLAVSVAQAGCSAFPGASRVRLAHNVAARLTGTAAYEASDAGKLMVPMRQELGEFCGAPVDLGALYLLDRRDPDASAVEVEAVSNMDRFMELLRFSYCAGAMNALGLEQRRFQRLISLARHVPVRRLRYPSGFDSLGQVERVIERELLDR